MTTIFGPGSPMLAPRGGPVVVRDARKPGDSTEIRLPTDRSPDCYTTFARQTAGLPGAAECLRQLTEDGIAGAVDTQGELDDAARRVGPANTKHAAPFERGVELVQAAFGRAGDSMLVLPAADRIDPPSMRLIITAWFRRAPRPGAGLILEVVGLQPVGGRDLAEDTRALAFHGVLAAFGATWEAVPSPASDERHNAPYADDQAVRSFLRRNYPYAAVVAPPETADGCLVRALIAARTGNLSLALAELDRGDAVTRDPRLRARGYSARTVMLCKYGGTPDDLAAAELAVARGLEVCGEGTDPDARVARGWLCNNAGLIYVLRNIGTGNPAHRDRAEWWLKKALMEAGRLPPGHHTGLKFNALINAVQLSEMKGELGVALAILDKAYHGLDHPAYHYRRAILMAKVERMVEALAALEQAEGACDPLEWPFLDHIERARGQILYRLGRCQEAAEAFARGITLCREVRSAAGVLHHATGLTRCCRALGNTADASAWSDRLRAEEGLMLPRGPGEPPKPSSKLPPYVPELDLDWSSRPDINRRPKPALEDQK